MPVLVLRHFTDNIIISLPFPFAGALVTCKLYCAAQHFNALHSSIDDYYLQQLAVFSITERDRGREGERVGT